MATCEREFERNLSEESSSKKRESGSISYGERDDVIGSKNDEKTGLSTDNVDRNDLVKGDQNRKNRLDRQSDETNVNCSTASVLVESEKEGHNDLGPGAIANEFDKNSQPLPRPGGKRVDEALLEEDEMGCSEDEEEHYQSAEEEHLTPEEEHLTPEEAEERMKEALGLKKEGNDHFRKQEYLEGKDLYTKAIRRCPKEFTENKSIFYANRAACFQKLEEFENAISDCNQALELAPNYIKARLRRAQCYEKVEKLEEALEDYKIVFENDKSCQPAREAILRLPEEIKIKHEKLKEEMIGKLKDLGNMVLRPFGLSTDNFNLQQDPNSGGYSINFQR